MSRQHHDHLTLAGIDVITYLLLRRAAADVCMLCCPPSLRPLPPLICMCMCACLVVPFCASREHTHVVESVAFPPPGAELKVEGAAKVRSQSWPW